MDNSATKVYIITDTHFGHTLMQKFCNRPPDFDSKIIKQWRATVNPNDIVYHLGDVTWGSQGDLTRIMKGLPGTKILIRGNHDRNHSNNWFIKAGFSAVLEKAQISGVILSHFPALLHKEEIERGIINVHGHFHNNDPKRWETHMKRHITENHYLLSLEDVSYKPISLEMIRRRKFVKNSKKLVESESE
jgi:calcineurin-like phosphoesterase family protein